MSSTKENDNIKQYNALEKIFRKIMLCIVGVLEFSSSFLLNMLFKTKKLFTFTSEFVISLSWPKNDKSFINKIYSEN